MSAICAFDSETILTFYINKSNDIQEEVYKQIEEFPDYCVSYVTRQVSKQA